MPRLSSGHIKNILMRMAAVKAATQAVPNALLALCNMILPIAVIENCNPIGTPIYINLRARAPLNFRSSGVPRNISKRRIMYP